MIKLLYYLYQICIAAPLLLLISFFASLATIIGCSIGNGHFWGYYPGMIWARAFCRILLLPINIEGREHLREKQSYVFVANHQGSFDIFLIYGFLGRNFKWMMKKELRQMFLIGKACAQAGHIFVDKRGPKAIQHTYDCARSALRNGTSLVVFPEGARTFSGGMQPFRKGAFLLAQELGLDIVPVTINGSFQVMPRTNRFGLIQWHPLNMKIHTPLSTHNQDEKEIREKAYNTIMQSLSSELIGK